jgi:SAM-dependent methyltransferase
VAQWLADAVGASGHVTAIDRDTALLHELGTRANVTVVQGDLMTMSFGTSCFDLAHSRAVLMHLDHPDTVVEHLMPALAPGAVVLFEETDGEPAVRAAANADLPAPFVDVLLPLAAQWTWARTLAGKLEALGFTDVHDDVREDLLTGATPGAAFWRQTLATIRPIVTDATHMESLGRNPVDDRSYDTMMALLEDPGFMVPFSARHRVSGRRP